MTKPGVTSRLREPALRCSLAAIAHPRRALAVWLLATLLPLPGLLFLRIDTDGRALVPRDDPAVREDAEIRRRFHLRDQLVVAIHTDRPEGVFNPSTLRVVKSVTEQLAAQPEMGAEHVLSLATEKRDRLLPGSSASFVSFLEPFPETPADWEALRRDLDSPAARVYEGVLVSRDRRTVAVLGGLENGDAVDRRALYRRIEAAVRPSGQAVDRIRIVGAPVAEALLGDEVLRDLALLVPLSVALLAAVLWLGTRRAACVAVVLGKAGACIAWTFAVLACLGIPLYLTTAVLPVILATLCMADEVHLLLRFQKVLSEEGSAGAAAARTMSDLVTPVVLATATTCVGFLSFLSSPVAPVRALGLGAALGVGYSLAFSLGVTPALLAALPARLFLRASGRRGGRLPTFRPTFGMFQGAVRKPAWTLGGIAAVTLAAGTGLARLTVHDSWIESFAPESGFRRDTEAVNRSLNGTHLLRVHLPFQSRDCTDPEVLARLAELEAFLGRQPEVGGVSGLSSQLTALAHFWVPSEDPAAVLRRPREVLRLLHRYELSPGLIRRREVIDDTFRETVVTIFLKSANYRDTQLLMSRLKAWHRLRLEPLGAGLGYAGDVAVSQATIPAIVRTQVLSLPLALLGVLLVTAALYRSIPLALAALFPITLGAVWLLGALGWAGIPLGVATSMFFAIALGLGVDSQSIHFLDRYHELRAVDRTLEEVGPAIAVNTLAVAAGFGLLAASSVPANARLGLLISVSLALGAFLTLAGLGSLLSLGSTVPRTAASRSPDPIPERRQS